jgi:hypothetical protein
MPGFDAMTFGASSLGGAREDEAGEAQDFGAHAPSPMIGVRNESDGEVQRKTTRPTVAGRPATSKSAAGRPVNADLALTSRAPTDFDASEQSPARAARAPVAVVDSRDRVTGLEQAAPLQNGTNEIAASGDQLSRSGAGERAQPAFADGDQFDAPKASRGNSVEAERPFLEPRPRALTSSEQHESISHHISESDGRPDQGPRVIIGRINIEVVQPAAEPKASASHRPGPLTAASVSVIGPLRRANHSNLRLSLRHR